MVKLPDMRLNQSKNILITGAGSGIGKDVAFALARRGHKVIATTETAAQASTLQTEARQNNLSLTVFKLDITQASDRAMVTKHEPIDVLINNAAIGESGSLAEIDLKIVRHIFEINVFSQFELAQIVLSSMLARGSGTIIFISSTAGRIVVPFLGPYCMTKFALSAGVEALRAEVKHINKNINISLVEPGAYYTGFNQKMIASQFLHMQPASFFYLLRQKIQQRLEFFFQAIEVRTTTSIVKTIVHVVQAKKPRLRYTAPWWQALGVRIGRMLGK